MTSDSSSPTNIWTKMLQYTKRNPLWLILAITLVALILRIWQLDSVPPGWRDDELINSLVISQKAINGDLAVYYADASGHEALYHLLSAGTLALFGPGVAGIRLLPALLGTITVILTYLLASQLFGRKVALLASLALAVSFWSLMYSRIGIRHISLPVFMLASFICFWRGLQGYLETDGEIEAPSGDRLYEKRSAIWFALAGMFLGIGFYTYFASRGIPIILLLFGLYLFLFQRDTIKRGWRGFLLMFGLALILAVPLIVTLQQQPETEARVEELAVPLAEAREGNFAPLGRHIARTINMFHSDGDDEWLYNIPYRPVFGPVGAIFFWVGFAVALWYAAKPVSRLGYKAIRGKQLPPQLKRGQYLEGASAFVLIWWLVGISPGFISVPAASLGHTIIAQSAVYILAALPILPFGKWLQGRYPSNSGRNSVLIAAMAGTLLIAIAWRDLPDYFSEWPSRGMTRFLYRAEIRELAEYLNTHDQYQDYGVAGLLAGPWDRLALEIELDRQEDSYPRWYNSERAVFIKLSGEQAVLFSGYPSEPSYRSELYQLVTGEEAGGFSINRMKTPDDPPDEKICFENGLCLLAPEYNPDSGTLDLDWEVSRQLDLPPLPLVSNPPPPGLYSGPRLSVFAQMVDLDNSLITGDDGLWVDVTGLQAGDRFVQQHKLSAPGGSEPVAILYGLYDPKTGERILTLQGQDHIRLDLTE